MVQCSEIFLKMFPLRMKCCVHLHMRMYGVSEQCAENINETLIVLCVKWYRDALRRQFYEISFGTRKSLKFLAFQSCDVHSDPSHSRILAPSDLCKSLID